MSTSTASIPELKQCNSSIYIFQEPPNEPTAEVIFFHDIHWDEHKKTHIETWMSNSSPSICWPKDWLSIEFPEAKILSVRYDAARWRTNTTDRMDLYRIAENLWQDILEIYPKNCPVFLVGHGLGGLVIKTVIHSMKEKLGCTPDNQVSRKGGLSSFLENIQGVFFYNSPFLGIRLVDYTKVFPHGNPLLEIIRTLNAEASRLNEWFREWRSGRCTTIAVHAALSTKVALGYGSYWNFEVVEEASARYDIDQFYTSASDHFSISKPPDQIDNRFSMLVKLLRQKKLPGKPLVGITDSQEDSAENACSGLLTTILNRVARSKRLGVTSFYLKREDLDKIRQFPEMEKRLVESLNKDGLHQTRVNAHFELWASPF